jgi:hypothetical protein
VEAEGAARCRRELVVSEVVAALESLYADELRPYGRILRKRLAERIQEQGVECVHEDEVDSGTLQKFCEGCPLLSVESEAGGEFSVLMVGRESSFVDIYSKDDPYPEDMWEKAAEYFQSLSVGAADGFPGGRFATAAELMARQLSFLQGRSLGQVCHIVQLSIVNRSLLGYADGAIVPYCQSISMRKMQCAELGRPCGGRSSAAQASRSSEAPLTVASWAETRRYVYDILSDESQKGQKVVPLSNIKRLFRSRYSLELSETSLGHAKLSELLQDSRFDKICTVSLEEKGYMVALVNADDDAGRAALDAEPCEADTESLEAASPRRLRQRFLELETPPAQLARPRSFSCPKDFAQSGRHKFMCSLAQEAEADEDRSPVANTRRSFLDCEGQPLRLEEEEPLPGCVPLEMPPSPSPHYRWGNAAPLELPSLQAVEDMGMVVQTPSPVPVPQHRAPVRVVRLAELIPG